MNRLMTFLGSAIGLKSPYGRPWSLRILELKTVLFCEFFLVSIRLSVTAFFGTRYKKLYKSKVNLTTVLTSEASKQFMTEEEEAYLNLPGEGDVAALIYPPYPKVDAHRAILLWNEHKTGKN